MVVRACPSRNRRPTVATPEPVQLVAEPLAAGYSIAVVGGSAYGIGAIQYGLGWWAQGWPRIYPTPNRFPTRDAAALALARACGIENALPPREWPEVEHAAALDTPPSGG